MAEKELTPREHVRKNLESRFYQDVFASNNYQTDVGNGSRGADSWLQGSYDAITEGKEFSERKERDYADKKEMMKEAGVYGEPSMPTKADISLGIVDTVQRSLEEISLEDLYSVMTSIDSDVKKYTLPDRGKNFSKNDIIKKAIEVGAVTKKDGKNMLNIEKLPEEYQEAYMTLETLRKIYKESCTESLRKDRRQKTFEGMGKQRDEQFHPTKPESS